MRSPRYAAKFPAMMSVTLLLAFLSASFTAVAQENEPAPSTKPAAIPADIKEWMWYEQKVNRPDIIKDPIGFQPIDVKTTVPREFNPVFEAKFHVPYIEVPASEVQYTIGDNASKEVKDLLLFNRGGKQWTRVFFHPIILSPNIENDGVDLQKIRDVIKKWGGLKWKNPKGGYYTASPSSSPRSLTMYYGNTRIGLKVSLPVRVGGENGIIRINEPDKLYRSAAVNEAVARIPAAMKTKFKFDFMAEPAQQLAPGLYFGNIVRQYNSGFLTKGMPLAGFALMSPRPGQKKIPKLIEMMEASGQPPMEFLREQVWRPLARAYVYTTFVEGLVGEPHQQNAALEVKGNKFTGRVIYRDLDANRSDLVVRGGQGRSLQPYLNVLMPFKFLKLNKAPEFYDTSYGRQFRQDWGFGINKILEMNKKRLKLPDSVFANAEVLTSLDHIFFEEAVEVVGAKSLLHGAKAWIKANRAALEALIPNVDWENPTLTKKQMQKLLSKYSLQEMHGKVGQGWWEYPFELNKVAEQYRVELMNTRNSFLKFDGGNAVLKREFYRLVENFRGSKKPGTKLIANMKANSGIEYRLFDGGIAAVNKANGKIEGIALLEPDGSGKGFYDPVPEKYRKTRKMPGADFRKVWANVNKQAGSAGCKALRRSFQQSIGE